MYRRWRLETGGRADDRSKEEGNGKVGRGYGARGGTNKLNYTWKCIWDCLFVGRGMVDAMMPMVHAKLLQQVAATLFSLFLTNIDHSEIKLQAPRPHRSYPPPLPPNLPSTSEFMRFILPNWQWSFGGYGRLV